MNIYQQISANKTKTWLLMTSFVGLFVLLSWLLGEVIGYGSGFIVMALVLALFINIGSYFYGDQIVLAMSHAKPANRQDHFDFFTVAENLSLVAGIPKPKLYVIEDTAMNAFATGRDPHHAVIVVTTGILNRLDRRELEGVVAHELSHIKNYDIRLLLITAVLVGTLAFLADWFLRGLWWGERHNRNNRGNTITVLVGLFLAILTPILAQIIQLAISRQREYLADASGAYLTRYPEGLARALEKLNQDKEVLEAATNATAHLYIINPFKGKEFSAWFANLFDTHPPIEERIRRLRSL